MAVTFQAVGALGEDAANASVSLVAPACQEDDILIACLINKELTVTMSAPDSTWTQIYQADADCTTAADDHRAAIFWKRATQSDTGATFVFTKSADNNVLYAGVISTWRGCNPFNPVDATAVGATVTVGAADNVTFPAFNPTSAEPHVIFIAFYGNDVTTFNAAMSADVNPDCTLRWDLETATGSDCTIAGISGTNDGSNIASRTWASASMTDAGSTGVVFALVPKPAYPNNYQHAGASSTNAGVLSITEKIK